MTPMTRALLVLTFTLLLGRTASAQTPSSTPSGLVTGGYAAFVDEGPIGHGVVGAGLEWIPWRHMAVGPEVVYMVGPGTDRDLFVLGMARFGFVPFGRAVVPFVSTGAGVMRHSAEFVGRRVSSTEAAFVFGGGVRINATPRVFIAPEAVVGWEPHVRATVTVGVRLGR
jgi:hypothetical protein